MSGTKIGIFWPGDYRSKPNDLARPNAEEATGQLERALNRRRPRLRDRVLSDVEALYAEG